MDLTTATPAEIDAEINRIQNELVEIDAKAQREIKVIEKVDNAEPGSYDARVWTPAKRDAAVKALQALAVERDELTAAVAPLTARYAAERWTRYYLVDNTNGHVHTSKGCRTCFDTTRFVWLTEHSGTSHDDLTALAGEDSCAECFPNLPPEIMKRKTRIEDPAKRKTRLEREAAKAAREAKRIAKGITTSDGSPLRITVRGYSETLKTETAAAQWIVRHLGEHKVYDYHLDITAVGIVLEALAAKHGVGIEIEGPQVAAKVAAWVKRTQREIEKYRAQYAG